MLKEFETELITTIKEVCKNTRTYLGEFEDKNEMELLIKGGECFAFIEFMGDNYVDTVRKNATYNIHILAATSSKTSLYRQNNKFAALDMCESIDEKLRSSVLNNEFQILLKGVKVRLNAITDYGYVYVLTREIQTDFLKRDEFLCS